MTLVLAKRTFILNTYKNSVVYALNIQSPFTSDNFKAIYKRIACLKLCLHAFSLVALCHAYSHSLFSKNEDINFIVGNCVSFFQQHFFENLFELRSSLLNAFFKNFSKIFNRTQIGGLRRSIVHVIKTHGIFNRANWIFCRIDAVFTIIVFLEHEMFVLPVQFILATTHMKKNCLCVHFLNHVFFWSFIKFALRVFFDARHSVYIFLFFAIVENQIAFAIPFDHDPDAVFRFARFKFFWYTVRTMMFFFVQITQLILLWKCCMWESSLNCQSFHCQSCKNFHFPVIIHYCWILASYSHFFLQTRHLW